MFALERFRACSCSKDRTFVEEKGFKLKVKVLQSKKSRFKSTSAIYDFEVEREKRLAITSIV